MSKTKSQRASRRRRAKAVAANAVATRSQVRALTVPVMSAAAVNAALRQGPKKSKRKSRAKKGALGTVPRYMSAVNDGINTGMVWKNSNSVRDFFAPRFEKVCDLTSTSTAFNLVKQFYLNPGNSVLFPVFAQIASTYEEYVCHRLRFWYRGEAYTASGSNVSAGICVYSTNMDPDDSNFSSVDQMENYEGSVSGPPFSGHFMHDVNVVHRAKGRNRLKGDDLSLNQYFVYSSANQIAPSSTQGKFYDVGNFQVALNGVQAGLVGELWVEHSWTMIRRKQQTPLGQNIVAAHYSTNSCASATVLTTMSQKVNSNLSLTLASTTITIPTAGRYLVQLLINGATSVTSGGAITAGSNATLVTTPFFNGGNTTVRAGSGASAFTETLLVDITGSSGVLNFPAPTIVGAGTADLCVVQWPGALNAHAPLSDMRHELGQLHERLMALTTHLSRCVIEPESPHECKEVDLSESIHIPRGKLSELLYGKK